MKIYKTILGIGLIAFALLLFTPPAGADPLSGNNAFGATNLPAVVTTGAQSNTTSYVDVTDNSGLSLMWRYNVSSGTSNAVLLLYPSNDRTNFASTPWTIVDNANGATDRFVLTNWSAAQLRGIKQFKVGALTNQNAGTLTNKGVIFNRPLSAAMIIPGQWGGSLALVIDAELNRPNAPPLQRFYSLVYGNRFASRSREWIAA